jgi:hypothetical protein
MKASHHQQQVSDGAGRTNRFLSPHHGHGSPGTGSDTPLGQGHHLGLRERAASQPPRSNANAGTSPLGTPTLAFGTSPGSATSGGFGGGMGGDGRGGQYTPRTPSSLNPHSLGGMPQSVPTRSTSFSGASYNAAYAPTVQRGFASTYEDDELDGYTDDGFTEDSYYNEGRGRSFAIDATRSRSQSLIPIRQPPIGSPFRGNAWDNGSQASSYANPSRYGEDELRPPHGQGSRYGGLNAANFARSPPGGGQHAQGEVSNISPFVRDVGQIVLDDGSAFRELWAGMNPPRDENGGGAPPGSGTTSRRHSVSVVQPRRDVGFGAPEQPIGGGEMSSFSRGVYGRGRALDDDDLAAELGLLNMNESGGSIGYQQQHQRHLSGDPSVSVGSVGRSPTADRMGYGLKLAMPSSGPGFPSALGSPADHANAMRQNDASYLGGNAGRAAAQVLGARYVPGQGIQYPTAQGMETLVSSPGGTSLRYAPPGGGIHGRPQHAGGYAPQMARRASDASSIGAPVALADVGKGVPLSAVPPSWPLYIIEFKAGRTDLYYCTNLTLDIRRGDLVIVEADRGKDLGTVVNDSITHAEVEAFQQQQMAKAGWGGDGTGTGPQSKEINPKMIYGKASANDAQ